VILSKEGFDLDLVMDSDVRSFANWTFHYLSVHGEAPSPVAIEREFSITDEGNPELPPTYLLEQLRTRKKRKARQEIVEKLIDEEDPEKFSQTLVDEGYKLWSTTSSQKHILTMEDHPEMIKYFQLEAQDQRKGASYGFVPLDYISGGAKKGHLSFLAARPKRYKTWIGLKAFVEQARQGLAPVFFNLELSDVEIYQRLVCLVSGVSFAKMKHNRLTDRDWDLINERMGEFADCGPAYIVSPPYDNRTVDDLVLEVQKLQSQSVIIDQLSYLQWKGNYASEHQGYREVVHNMKNAAIKLEIPWFCICQFNREAANVEEMAGAQMAGLTRAIEETCDMFLGLHRDKEDLEMGRVQLGIVEARHCSANHKWDIEVEMNNNTSFTMREER
jgi:replicative DNA helicase